MHNNSPVAMPALFGPKRPLAEPREKLEGGRRFVMKTDFEAALKQALADGEDPRLVEVATARSLEPTRVNGSNVNLDEETLAAQQTVLSTQLAAQAMTNKFNGIKTAIGN